MGEKNQEEKLSSIVLWSCSRDTKLGTYGCIWDNGDGRLGSLSVGIRAPHTLPGPRGSHCYRAARGDRYGRRSRHCIGYHVDDSGMESGIWFVAALSSVYLLFDVFTCFDAVCIKRIANGSCKRCPCSGGVDQARGCRTERRKCTQEKGR